MKLLVATLLCWISVSAYSQQYSPDISGEPGDYTIFDYYTKKVYAKHVKVDDFVLAIHNGLYAFRKGEKYGLMNIYGKIVVPAIYDDLSQGEGGYPIAIRGDYFAMRKGEQTTLIDSTGAFAVPLGNYDYLWDAGKGICGASLGDNFGLFKKGKVILPMIYRNGYNTFEFTHETMPFGNDSLSGLINTAGKIVLPVEYTYISELNDNYWLLEKDGLKGLADMNGKIVTPCSIEFIGEVHDGMIFGTQQEKYGVQKLDGTIICPYEYDFMTTKPVDGAVFARKDYLWGYLSLAHPEKTAFIYSNRLAPYWNSNGIAVMEKNGLWGMINTKNEIVCDFQYLLSSDYFEFRDGKTFVSKNGLTGMISDKGKLVIPCEYEEIERSGYFPKKAKKNGKYGVLAEDGTLIVPCAYDEIRYFDHDECWLVELDGKKGLYHPENGLIIPTRYNEIEISQNQFATTLNGKRGLYNESGKELLPAQFDTIYHFNSKNALVNREGILELYDLTNSQEKTLTWDSIIAFDKIAFVTFGKLVGDDYQIDGITYQETSHEWYCINNETHALIGKPYWKLGPFNAAGNAAAQIDYYDSPIAINSKGEELKPNFILLPNVLFNTFVFDDSKDTILNQFKQRGLLKQVPASEQWEYIHNNFDVQITPQDYYDEYGDAIPAYYLSCYEKGSYFDFESPFPEKPYYEYNFYQFYSRTSVPNTKGLRWAVKRGNEVDGEFPINFEQTEVILVNRDGEEMSKHNYTPVQSNWFFEAHYPQEVDWNALIDYPETLHELKTYFPGASALSDEAFLTRYKDSVFYEYTSVYNYDYDYIEQALQYNYLYYKAKNLQLFNFPPPENIEYRFSLRDIKQLKGGETLSEPDFKSAFFLGSKTANTFGKKSFFAYPIVETASIKDRKAIETEYLETIKNEEIKENLRQFDYYTKLIESGLAKAVGYEEEGELQQLVSGTYANDLMVYSYDSSVGLAIDNELLIAPKYLAIAPDTVRINGVLETSFIVVDSLFNIYRFNEKTRKLTKLKDERLCISKFDGLITQSKSSKLYHVYNKGYHTNEIWNYDYMITRTYPVKNAKRLFFINDCNSYPLITMYGEDSIVVDENGVESYVYVNHCDTVVTGPYSSFPQEINYDWYEGTDGMIYRFNGENADTMHFSEYVMQSSIQINEAPLRRFLIHETPKGMELMNEDGKTLLIPYAEYEKLITLREDENGFGGVFRKGKFIPYETFLPFPEKQDVYIHFYGNFWLIGTKNELELVILDPSGNTSIKKRYHQTFQSYEDFLRQYLAETASMNPVQLFMWEEYGY